MENEIKDKILNLFIDSDDLRSMDKPFTRPGKTYATNGHVLVSIDGKDERYLESKINVERVIPEEQGHSRIIIIDELRAALDSIPKVEKMETVESDCNECGGEGLTVCSECEQERDCPECKGEGKLSLPSKPTGIFIEDESEKACILIDEAMFRAFYARKLIVVADILGIKSITRKTESHPTKANLFYFTDELFVLLMSMRYESKDGTVSLNRYEVKNETKL